MANKYISQVSTGTSLNYIYGRENGDIIQVPASLVKVGRLTPNSVFTPSEYSNRCTLKHGGYYMLGNMCFVQVRFQTKDSFASDGYYRMLYGFPQPAVNDFVPLCAIPQTTESSQIVSAMIDANGYLAICSSSGIVDQFNYTISGWYII